MKTPPALFTRMLTGPSSATVRSSATIHLGGLADVGVDARARRPPPPAAAAVSALRSQMATFAPKAAKPRAMPRPIPEPPPVTTATRSVSRTDEGSIGTR